MWKSRARIGLLLIASFAIWNRAGADSFCVGGGKEIPELEEDYAAVVPVRAPKWTCTGTFLNATTLLTAGHCIAHDRDGAGFVSVRGVKSKRVFENPRYKMLRISPWVQDAGPYDVALVVFDEDTGTKLGIRKYPRIADRAPRAGDRVEMVGYGINHLAKKSGGGVKRWGENVLLSVGRMLEIAGVSIPGDQSGKKAAGLSGDSGGPLFNESGEIVGITSYIAKPRHGGEHLAFYVNPFNHANLKLFREAVRCSTAPCAQDFGGSRVPAPGAPPPTECLERDETKQMLMLMIAQNDRRLRKEEQALLDELWRRRNRFGNCDEI